MNAQILYTLKGIFYKDSGIFFCSNCRIVYCKQEDAEKCCKCIYCQELVEKHPNRSGSYTYHDKCWEVKRLIDSKKFEEEKFTKATKITAKEWTKNEHSWIFSESYSSNDGYCDIHDFIDQFGDDALFCPECGEETREEYGKGHADNLRHLECECGWKSPQYTDIEHIFHLFLPKYVWATEFEPVQLDIGRILENVLDSHYEDCECNGVKELSAAIDKFNQDNLEVGSYNVNYKVAITNLEELL